MKKTFNTEEIRQATQKLKNNKTPGVDQLIGEQVKYGPEIVHQTIAEILNKAAETGEY